MIVTGVAKRKVQKQKGELIEQNQDGLEYSSEEESENLHETAAGIANKQKRELAKVDHAKTEYLPFRKSFYVEVPEIGINFFITCHLSKNWYTLWRVKAPTASLENNPVII